LTKVVIAVIAGVSGVGTSAVAFALWYTGMATDEEVKAEIYKHNHRPRDADNAENSAHPAYAHVATKLEQHLLHEDNEDRARKRRDQKILEYLVSLQAADLEPDKRRKADAAAFARTAFREAIKAGTQPEDAAEQALDSRPPWRR
jgi:hypothetical protein